MKKIKLFRDYKDLENKFIKTTVAIGNFDGLHLGHQGLLKKAKNLSIHSNSKLLVFTFYPHPLKIIRSGSEPKNISRFSSKLRRLQNLGVEIVLAQKFSHDFSKTSAKEFVEKILLRYLNAVKIVVGQDFCFGYKRQGNIEFLSSGILDGKATLEIVKPIIGNFGRYSSTAIRDLISKGNMEKVKNHLGSFYEVEGKVIKGKMLGRKLGYPTANINYLDCIIPKDGIYAGLVFYSGEYHKAALSTGVRPHFKGDKRFLEAHILNFKKNIYGSRLRVIFVARIRDEMIFKNTDSLKKQMSKDCLEVKRILDIKLEYKKLEK